MSDDNSHCVECGKEMSGCIVSGDPKFYCGTCSSCVKKKVAAAVVQLEARSKMLNCCVAEESVTAAAALADAAELRVRVAALERLHEIRMEPAPGALPCPHCGEARIAERPNREPGLRIYVHRRFPGEPDDGPEALDYVVGCGSCAAEGGKAHSVSGAVDMWNLRTPTAEKLFVVISECSGAEAYAAFETREGAEDAARRLSAAGVVEKGDSVYFHVSECAFRRRGQGRRDEGAA